MAEINTLGNGSGYLYAVSNDNTRIISAYKNNNDNVREIRKLAAVCGPVAANRSAIGIIQITAAGATGNLTAITVAGINQIAANVPCVSAVPSVVAVSWANAVNSYVAGSGISFTAYAVDDLLYLVADSSAGASANGLAINVTTDTGTLTASVVQQLINGSSNAGVGDDNCGLLFYINSTTDAVPNPTFPLSADYVDVSKYLIQRGMQAGMVSESETISDDGIATNRYCAFTLYSVSTEGGGATDNLAFINPLDFVEGDIVYLRGSNPAQTITVLSAPLAGSSAAATPNIYTSGNSPFTLNTSTVLQLQYKYDATLGGIFTEIGRSTAGSTLSGNITYVSTSAGSDETGVINRIDKPFATLTAAINAVTTAGSITNTIEVMPGTYTITSSATFLASCSIYLRDGANVTVQSTAISAVLANLKILGDGSVTWGKYIDVANFPLLSFLVVECMDWTTTTSTINNTVVLFEHYITAKKTMNFGGAVTMDTNSGAVYSRIILTAPNPHFDSGIFHTNSNINLFINPTSGIANGYVVITNNTGKLWDFHVNGTLKWEINPAISPITINGNVWFPNYANFAVGFKLGGLVCSNSVAPIQLNTANVYLDFPIKHSLPSVADVPTVQINNTGISTLKIDSKQVYNFNSTGVSGIIYINNTSFSHNIELKGDFRNLSTNGTVLVAAAATANVLNNGVTRNVTLLGTNTSETVVFNTTNANIL